MKKEIAFLLAAVLLLVGSSAALAADETVLTATVPDAAYTLIIPANRSIPLGSTDLDLGPLTVENSSGFSEKKHLHVTVDYSPFTAAGVSTFIPFRLTGIDNSSDGMIAPGTTIEFPGTADGTVSASYSVPGYDSLYKRLYFHTNSDDWLGALGGSYSSTITFTSEVVSSSANTTTPPATPAPSPTAAPEPESTTPESSTSGNVTPPTPAPTSPPIATDGNLIPA